MANQSRPITASDGEIEAAVLDAHIPTLIMSLYHLTADETLLSLPRPVYQPFSGSMDQGGLSEEIQADVRKRASAALIAYRDGAPMPPEPDQATLTRMMNYIGGTDIPSNYLPFLMETLGRGIDQPEPALSKPAATSDETRPARDTEVVIVGAGMNGLLMAYRLKQAGVPFVILEKNDDVGGTWHENRYPGCRVDGPSLLYSYSFDFQREWPSFYCTWDVNQRYFRQFADEHGIREHIRFGVEVSTARYDEKHSQWTLDFGSADGTEQITAAVMISAVGQLNRPLYPAIEGLESFAGPAFHSARWDDSVSLKGKRVGVIGTGASAFQFVPAIADEVGSMTVFQRTPPWLAPTEDYHDPMPKGMNWLFLHAPYFALWYRFWLFWMRTDAALPAVRRDLNWEGGSHAVSALNEQVGLALSQRMSAQLEGAEDLKEKMIPKYPFGSKRALRDNGIWLAALKKENVTVETAAITRIEPEGVILEDGRHLAFDVLLYGTGFQASNFFLPMKVYGKGGIEMQDYWGGDARAYLGMMVPHFPNFFSLYGPNTNIVVNGSLFFFAECAVRYIMQCVSYLVDGGGSIEVREDVYENYGAQVDAANTGMAWGAPDAVSWYKNAKGKVTQNWPFLVVDYWTQTLMPDPATLLLDGKETAVAFEETT